MKYYVKATIIIIICEIVTALIADLINADRSESIIRFMIVYMCIDTTVSYTHLTLPTILRV